MIEHGDGGGEGRGGVVARDQPADQGEQGDHEDHGHEDAGDPVGQALDLGLAGLRGLDEAGHLREAGVGADPGRADDEPAAGVGGGAGDPVAGADLDRARARR